MDIDYQTPAKIETFQDFREDFKKKNSKKSDIVTKGRQVGDQKPHFI